MLLYFWIFAAVSPRLAFLYSHFLMVKQQQQSNTQQIFKSIPLRITRDKCTAIVHKKSKHFWDIDVNKKGKSERTRDYRRAEVSTASWEKKAATTTTQIKTNHVVSDSCSVCVQCIFDDILCYRMWPKWTMTSPSNSALPSVQYQV